MASDGFDSKVLRDAYDAIAPEYAATFGGDLDQLDLDRALLDFVGATAADGLVLDVGCGPAQAGGYRSAVGTRVLGLDLSTAMAAAALDGYGSLGLLAARADMRQLPLPGGSCAGAVSFYAMHHLPRVDLPAMLAEFGRVLAPGAVLLLATHEGTGEFAAEDHPDIKGTLYSGDELELALAKTGFRCVQVHRRDPLPHERQSARVYVTAVADVPR
jgi:SAM-dependent methyltransferase